MAIKKFWTIAYRDLIRNRRRSIITLLAVSFGLAIIIMMSGFIAGIIDSGLRDNIRLNTGHLQLRAESYEAEKLSLLRSDMLENSDELAAQVNQMSEVETATDVLWASGVLSTIQESTSLKVTGIDPTSSFYAPIQEGIISGEFLTPDSRNEILISKRLADNMGIGVGQRVSLVVGNPDGEPESGVFTVRGLFDTGFPGFDENALFMLLSQAQAFTQVGNRASAIIIMLHDQAATEQVAAALRGQGLHVLTWEDLNSLLLETMQLGLSFYYIMYAIVMLIVAVIIANTLLMSVFERTREMGILAALGMKGRQIMVMFLLEASTLALVGIIVGIILGAAVVIYLSNVGIYIGDASSTAVQGITIGTTLYTTLVPTEIISLSLWMLAIVLLVSLYPAWYAARLEPVEALQAL